jgi:PilZ domain
MASLTHAPVEPSQAALETSSTSATRAHGSAADVAKSTRKRPRLKMSLPLQVQPFDARFADVRDVGEVIDFTRDGLYFASGMPHYFVGMRVVVTFPFGEKAAAQKRFLGSVVRVEDRPNGAAGVAVRFVL